MADNPSGGEEPLRFTAGQINVLVGPNNAGKSLMLRELSEPAAQSGVVSAGQAA